MDILINNIQNYSALGLFWDGFGIFVLGVPAFFRARKDIATESGTYFDFNPYEIRNKVSSRIDITIGSLLLLGGFIFQFLGSLDLTPDSIVAIFYWVFCPVFVIYYYLLGKVWFVNRWASEIEKTLRDREKDS